MPGANLPPKANEKDFVSHDAADELEDRGDDTPDEEEEEEGQPNKKVDKKATKKAAKKIAKKSEEEEEEGSEEEEEEGSEEEEEEGSEEEEDDEKGKKPDKRVVDRPRYDRMKKSRDKAAAEADELRTRLAALEEKKSDTAKKKMEDIQTKLDGLYEKVEDLRAEGKPKEAARVQREIDDLRGKMNTSQAAYLASVEAVKQADTRVYNGMVRELEVLDPRFDAESDEFDEDLVDEVGDLTEAYEARGLTAPEAFRKACKVVLREDVFAEGKSLKRSIKKAEPKKTDIKKNVDAAKKQPPEDPGATKDKAGKLNFAAMTEAEFDKLPESTKAKYRGDFDD